MTVPAATVPPASPSGQRLGSIDAYRGFVMFLLMAEALRSGKVAAALPTSDFWQFLAHQQDHVEWVGCTLHDLIQPSFSFLVGVALPFSLASRAAQGQSPSRLFAHALGRSLILILLGVYLRSMWGRQTYWTFEDTLTQIGLGYPVLYLLGRGGVRAPWVGLGIVLFGYWLAWALYPAAGPAFDFAAVAVPPDWPHHASGFAAHWNKNANLGNAFDQWFLNLFPREKPFVANGGGYLTLSFIPTLGTMILGLVAGRWLRAAATTGVDARRRLLLAGLACFAAGILLHVTGLCPVVKRIWTPAWTLFSGGWCFWFLAAFHGVIDQQGWKRWAFPLQVIGMNSIAAYLLTDGFRESIERALGIHFGTRPFALFGEAYTPFCLGIAVILVEWLILYWMYRRKIFLKI